MRVAAEQLKAIQGTKNTKKGPCRKKVNVKLGESVSSMNFERNKESEGIDTEASHESSFHDSTPSSGTENEEELCEKNQVQAKTY